MGDQEAIQRLHSRLEDDVGEDYQGLFVCTRNNGTLDFDEVYLQREIREHYNDDDRMAMTREAVLRALERGYLEDLYQLGDHRFTIEWFTRAALLFIALDATTAIVIGLTPDADLDHTTIALDCLDVLGL